MRHLYAQLFATRCSKLPSHGHDAARTMSALNAICYMWWDVMPIHGEPNDPRRARFDEAVLALLSDILTMDSLACQERALHGLGGRTRVQGRLAWSNNASPPLPDR